MTSQDTDAAQRDASPKRSAIEAALDALACVMLALAGIALAIMALHIVADIGGRYLFSAPLPGTVEIVARYYMVLLVFLPLAWVQKENAHFAAGIFTDRLSVRARIKLQGFTQAGMAVVAALLAWVSVLAAQHATSVSEQVQAAEFIMQVWPARWVLPASFASMAVYAALQAWNALVLGTSTDRTLREPRA